MKRITLLCTAFCATAALWASNFTPALFTISANGKQVYFSQGNLRYTQKSQTWSFAENQYDMIGAANVRGSALAGVIDLFGWSANNTTAQWGISTSASDNDYLGKFVDWGANKIGTNAPNTYRTLTKDEWYYLLNTRTDAVHKYGVACIKLSDTDFVNGLVVLPDNWTYSGSVTFKDSLASDYTVQAYAAYQTFTLAQWQELEAAGAVFLPASGFREGVSINYAKFGGYYWSATAPDNFYASYQDIFSSEINTHSSSNRKYGRAVRLVQDFKYALSLLTPEYGKLEADKTEAALGETVTLTITPDEGFELKAISVKDAGDNDIALSADYKFKMPASEVTISVVFKKIASASAAFTVSAVGKQVYFALGNLQYTQSTKTWSFAENQYDGLGAANVSNSALADKIDLLGWSGSTGSVKWGIGTSFTASDYSGDFVDWGKNIGDGLTCRTLTNDEWDYLLNTRTNASEKKGVACIKLSNTDSVNGLILLPDSWEAPAGITFKHGFASENSAKAYAVLQTFTLAEWQKLEAAGAVFLPTAGYRSVTAINDVQKNGNYWSATTGSNANQAGNLSLLSNNASTSNERNRNYGQAVRLVYDIKHAVVVTALEHGKVTADKTEVSTGETVTLTITPDENYELERITVKDANNQAVIIENDRFVMPQSAVTISAEFKEIVSAFTPAAFTVAAGKQVYFSQGNLQYTQRNKSWSFAGYQCRIIGAANVSGSALAGVIDLFGWSADNETAKWGISTSEINSDYSGNFVDWGANRIGTSVPNTFRTLTKDEWEYLLKTRANADNLVGVARVNLNSDGTRYANGLVLLPDDWEAPAGITFEHGFASENSAKAYADWQTFTLAEWQKLEAAGAVFLPTASYRTGAAVSNMQLLARYWAATEHNSEAAYGLNFASNAAEVNEYDRNYGHAVRLVQNLYAITIDAPTNGSIEADKSAAIKGEFVTLTITPDTGYELDDLTIQDASRNDVTLSVGYTFEMPASGVTINAVFKKIAVASAAFTVSAKGKQVYFSQGNLQYTQSTQTWSFAENQYDVLGTDNVSNSALADKIDLFGWSGSKGSAKWGIGTSFTASDYSGDFVDWGENTIGTNAPDTYRTLTMSEWQYLLKTRANADGLVGVARINLNEDGTKYANGLILLPDSWKCPIGVDFKSGFATAASANIYADYQAFTLVEWQKLEAAGAIFLPAAGYRSRASLNEVQGTGVYWAATPSGSSGAYDLSFLQTKAITESHSRFRGQAVRLVQDIEHAVILTVLGNGKVTADKTEASTGETVTLTITPDEDYELETITAKDANNQEVTIENNQFVMPQSAVTVTAEFKEKVSTFTPAAFTVAADKQIAFAQGNLQYAQSAKTWAFAENQYDVIGAANVSGSALASEIDLFGWSGDTGSAQWGISTSTDKSDYSGDFVDWGANTIGANVPNTFRTLTKDEWDYLLNTRTNASEKQGVARIKLSETDYANGLVLLPDDWEAPADITFKHGFASSNSTQAYADWQTFTLAQWQTLETTGAVFLPAAGYRNGADVSNTQLLTRYWAATDYNSESAYSLNFASNEAKMNEYNRYYGHAVRLVQDYERYAITTPTACEHGSVTANKTAALAGETITLTITPDMGYELEVLSVKDAANNVTVENNKFTMPASAVTVSATFKKIDYAITIAPSANGVVTAPATAQMGDEVELTVTPDTGCELDSLTAKDAENNDVTLSADNKFTMPASEVTVSATFKKIDYAITIDTEIENGAVSVTSDAATANYGDEVELTITPDEYYELDVLTVKDAENKEITVTNNTFSMPASEVTVSATFKKIDYAITIDTEIENGKITAVATANYGDAVELTITPDKGYELDLLSVKDTANNEITVADNKFTMPASKVTISATFKKIGYAITIASDIENGAVSVTSGATTANYGDAVELTITPVIGYELDVLLVKDTANTDIAITADNKFTMPASEVTVSATFKKIDYAITIASDIENGAVSVTSGAATANYGDAVELTIAPAIGYELDLLTVRDTANVEITVTNNKFIMPASKVTISATFKKIGYAITIASDIENGAVSVTSGATTANYGDAVELTITPVIGYELDVLLVKDTANVEITVTNNKFIMPASKVTISATFKKIDYAITIDTEIENGAVSVTSDAATANYGDAVELTIAPAMGYELDVLTVRDTANVEITVTNNKFIMPASKVTISATFKKIGYAITIASDIENGKITVVATANYGDAVELTIAPATGYELDVLSVKDTANNEITVTNNKFIMPASEVTISATFKKIGYAITIADDIKNGEVSVTSAATTANYGDAVELTIAPATGYELDLLSVKDTANNEITVTNNKFIMPASEVTVSATFKKIDYAITIASDIENGAVSVTSGAATANYGDAVELTVTPDTGCELDALTVKDADNNVITVSEDNTFTMPASEVTVSATFNKIDYAITIDSDIENGNIRVTSGATTANYGDEVELTVAPITGFELYELTVQDADGNDVTVSADNKFIMPASEVTVSALFNKKIPASIIFTVSADGKQVAFSHGNLQYTQSTQTWSFAENQYDMIGAANVSSGALADKIDLFGWSTNNTTAPWGISASTDNSDYSGDFVDWGENTIGTSVPNTFRTLTKDEWEYLIKTRANADKRIGIARIKLNEDGTDYANGLVLLPDSWTCPEGVTFKSGFANESTVEAYATHQTFTLADWQKLEATGAIFLPNAGRRNGSSMNDVQFYGNYWSSTPVGSKHAYYLYFGSNKTYTYGNYYRYYGRAVRLVYDIYPIFVSTPANGSIAVNKTNGVAGETVTLTVTPNTGYELYELTVRDASGNDVAVSASNRFNAPANAAAASDSKFEMPTNAASAAVNYKFEMPASAVTITATFKAQSAAALETAEYVAIYTENGRIVCDGEFQIFDLLGRNVTCWNGQLDGVYIVKVGDKAQKIIVSRK